MNVLLNTDQSQIEAAADSGKAPTAGRRAQGVPTQATPAQKPASENSKPLVTEPALQANVTLRRDGAGQIYYLFTDAQTGKELREFPPSEVRKAGQGVDELLKQEVQRAAEHAIDTKA